MKKIITLLMLAAMAVTSCTKDVDQTAAGGSDESFTVSVTLPSDVATRTAFEGYSTALTDMRLYVMISYDGKVVDTYTDLDWDGTTQQGEAIPFTLVTGLEYTVSAWVDFGDAFYTVTNTIGATPAVSNVMSINVTSKIEEYVLDGSDIKADAYMAVEPIMFSTSGEQLDLILTRPFGLIKVDTTDIDEDALVNAGLIPNTGAIQYMTLPVGLDLSTGLINLYSDNVRSYGYCPYTPTGELAYEYIFAEDEAAVYNFSYMFKKGGANVLGGDTTVDFNNIPIKRNYITNITGNLLTESGSFDITVDQTWEGMYSISDSDAIVFEYPSTGAEKALRDCLEGYDFAYTDLTILSTITGGNTDTSAILIPNSYTAEKNPFIDIDFAGGITGSVQIRNGDGNVTPYTGTVAVSCTKIEKGNALDGRLEFKLDGASSIFNDLYLNELGIYQAASVTINTDCEIDILDITGGKVTEIDVYGYVGYIKLGSGYAGQAVTINNYTTRTLSVNENKSSYGTENITIVSK